MHSLSLHSRLLRTALPRACQATRQFSVKPQVTAAMVKELRERSGAPMMDCKKALSAEGVSGDVKLAMDWLRTKGIAKAASSDRVTKEGLIAVNRSPSGAVTLLEVNSETDFVSLNRDFQLFVARVSEAVSQHSSSHFGPGPIDIEKLLSLPAGGEGAGAGSVKDALGDIVSSIRENIVIRRAEVLLPHREQGAGGSVRVVASYVHAKLGVGVVPAHIELGKVAAVVLLQATGALGQGAEAEAVLTGEVGRRLAMHVVASQPSPLYLSIADVPADVLLQETAIFREQSADDKKKADIVERIVAGKVAKRMGELCLLQQAHVAMEGSPVVHKYLESMGADGSTVSLTGFQRWSLGQ